MFESVLIANRGEIACRVARTARRLGIRAIAVHSDADADALHVRQADESVRIGPPPAAQSYLDIAALLRAIGECGAQAVHPGYGFLSENADFAAAVAAAGAVFVGPPPAAIRAMGSKIEAKRLAAEAGAPVVPGYDGALQDAAALAREADAVGFPLLVKASMGGGGRGMRLVRRAEDFAAALAAAKREARAAFGDERVLLERYLEAPKHIEVQILADAFGNAVSLFERDCSVQRRYQKVIEEAPAPTVDAAMRRAMGEAAVRAARAVDYAGAGTVEFIAEGDAFYFMEMNTRLQVEHAVTEAILGIDLVEWQLRVAAGEKLPFAQQDLAIDGHAIEARIYAENAKRGFLPSSGRLHRAVFPLGRADAGVDSGAQVTPHYDPMIAKLIVHGAHRREAIAAMDAALRRVELAGVEHNIAWLRNMLAHPAFRAGDYTTGTAERDADALLPGDDAVALAAAALAALLDAPGADAWRLRDGFQINLPHAHVLRVRHGDRRLELRVTAEDGDFRVEWPDGAVRFAAPRLDGQWLIARIDGRPQRLRIVRGGGEVFAIRDGATERIRIETPDAGAFGQTAASDGRIAAPMPGRIIAVEVAVGDVVQADQALVALEAMKMEHVMRAPVAGTVAAVHCAVGDRVDEGVELIALEEA